MIECPNCHYITNSIGFCPKCAFGILVSGITPADFYLFLHENNVIFYEDYLQVLIHNLTGVQSLPLDILFPSLFMLIYTKFPTLEIMLLSTGFNFESPAVFHKIPRIKLNRFIREYSFFDSWRDMQEQAYLEWQLRNIPD